MYRKSKIVAITVLLVGFSFAEVSNSTNAFDFETIELDARQVALGGASTLLPSSGTTHWGNPALLATSSKKSIGIAFSPLSSDISMGGLTTTFKLPNGISLAPSFRYLSVGEIRGLDNNGNELTQSISPYSLDGGVTAGYQWMENFSTGLSLKYVYEFLSPELESISSETEASALLADGGIYFLPTRNIALSAGFKNAGLFLKEYENENSDLPVSVYSGIRYFTKGISQSSLILECEKEKNYPAIIRPAIELQFLRELLSLRVGTSASTDDIRHFFDIIKGNTDEPQTYTKSESQIISVGAGLAVPLQDKTVSFDFATRILGDNMGINFAFSGGFIF